MKKELFFCIFLYCNTTFSKTILIKVVDNITNQPLIGASVYWENTIIGSTTDNDGSLKLERYDTMPKNLIASYTGYNNDTIEITGIESIVVFNLQEGLLLNEIQIKAKQTTQFISSKETGKVEVITSDELRKAACCNLAEGFQSNTAVEVSYSDAVTGAREIQMLGLEGAYIQHLVEGLPASNGIASAYYLDHIPAAWIKNIAVSKGVPSVKNGVNAVTGSINVDYAKPNDKEKAYIDLFMGMWGRTELAGRYAHTLKNKNWSTVFYGQGGGQYASIDRNNDGFIDIPKLVQANLMNYWNYNGKNTEAQFGIKYLHEERIGGQSNFKQSDKGSALIYGSTTNTNKIEYFAKNGIFFNKRPNQSMALTYNGSTLLHDQFIGIHQYVGEQYSNNFSIIGSTPLRNNKHTFNAGINFYSDIVREKLDTKTNNQFIYQTGIYVEYNYTLPELISLVVGNRVDYHNKVGWQYSPRIQFKYTPHENTTIRINAGKGFRYPLILNDALMYLVSSRNLMLHDNPTGDIAYNYGISYLQKFDIKNTENSLNVDFYRTDFVSQMMINLDDRNNTIDIHQHTGKSFSNSLMISLDMELMENLTVKVAYKFDDVRDNDNGTLLSKSMLAKHKGLATITYDIFDKGWSFTSILTVHGKERLPTSFENDIEKYSKTYALLNLQVSKKWKQWQWYAGVENIANFRQQSPILNAHQPFNYGFDATQIWGPVIGANAYTGIRFILKKKDECEY